MPWKATYIEIRFSANRIIGLLSAGVTIYMGSYWIKYGKFMHAGLVACVSFVVCSLNIRRSFWMSDSAQFFSSVNLQFSYAR